MSTTETPHLALGGRTERVMPEPYPDLETRLNSPSPLGHLKGLDVTLTVPNPSCPPPNRLQPSERLAKVLPPLAQKRTGRAHPTPSGILPLLKAGCKAPPPLAPNRLGTGREHPTLHASQTKALLLPRPALPIAGTGSRSGALHPHTGPLTTPLYRSLIN